MLTVLSALVFFATIVEWSERMSSDDIGVESDDFLEHLQYFSPVCIWIFFDLVRGRFGTQERLIVKANDGQNVEICGGFRTNLNTIFRCIFSELACFLWQFSSHLKKHVRKLEPGTP